MWHLLSTILTTIYKLDGLKQGSLAVPDSGREISGVGSGTLHMETLRKSPPSSSHTEAPSGS